MSRATKPHSRRVDQSRQNNLRIQSNNLVMTTTTTTTTTISRRAGLSRVRAT
ncbi:hypothetical protein E2C01_098759 [Portunus trituberculatus]|uniref:Uncharacterized protein n=1 Tax=Portunus trituberculatus TaxID=210409 RepID=A0A5B7K8I2_PORTR|nr:hypothetical protein [Portunus trituberculatus]